MFVSVSHIFLFLYLHATTAEIYPGHRKEYCLSKDQNLCMPAVVGKGGDSTPQKIRELANGLQPGSLQDEIKRLLPYVPEIRSEIRKAYKNEENYDLLYHGKEHKDDREKDIIEKVWLTTEDLYAAELMSSVKEKDFKHIVEILFANTNKLVTKIKGRFLERLTSNGFPGIKEFFREHLKSIHIHEKPYIKNLLFLRLEVVKEMSEIDPVQAVKDASVKSGNEWVEYMNKCLAEFSIEQLQTFVETFIKNEPDLKMNVEGNKFMKNKAKGSEYVLELYEYIFEIGKDPIRFLAKTLLQSFDTFSTDHDTLQRILIARQQIDLKSIENAYSNLPQVKKESHDDLLQAVKHVVKDPIINLFQQITQRFEGTYGELLCKILGH